MNLYRDLIISHYKNPLNKGELQVYTHSASKANTVCGDEITIQLLIENKRIKDIKFQGHGCAISQAVASMLTDYMKGEKFEKVKNLSYQEVVEMLGGGPISTGRVKCARLALDTFRDAITNNHDNF